LIKDKDFELICILNILFDFILLKLSITNINYTYMCMYTQRIEKIDREKE